MPESGELRSNSEWRRCELYPELPYSAGDVIAHVADEPENSNHIRKDWNMKQLDDHTFAVMVDALLYREGIKACTLADFDQLMEDVRGMIKEDFDFLNLFYLQGYELNKFVQTLPVKVNADSKEKTKREQLIKAAAEGLLRKTLRTKIKEHEEFMEAMELCLPQC